MKHNRRQYLWDEVLLVCNDDADAEVWLKEKNSDWINEHSYITGFTKNANEKHS